MKSIILNFLAAILGFTLLLVDASPINLVSPRGSRMLGLHNRMAVMKGTKSITKATGTAGVAKATKSSALDANAVNCEITVPANPLSAAGLASPYILQPPCSMSVSTQQAYAEAAIFDPATNQISVYHPLVVDAALGAAAAPVVPKLPAGAIVGLWFGFNGGVLKLVDGKGLDTNNSPLLKAIDCINGLAGVQRDVFGQVSWCNAEEFFKAVNAGKVVVPSLGVDFNGATCPTSRSFEITDACPSDNVPTQYLLLPNGKTAQDTAANRAAHADATVINNASDEALLSNIIDPLIGCTPFLGPSLDDPGSNVPALALSEIQAKALQAAPIGLVPQNDPDTLLTSNGKVSISKTNEYRLGVNQPPVGAGADSGDLISYCNDMIAVAPTFLKDNEARFSGATTPDATIGNNLFTFMCSRFITSLTQLTCPVGKEVDPVVCASDKAGVATSCTINLKATAAAGTGKGNTVQAKATGKAEATGKSKTAGKAKATGKSSTSGKAKAGGTPPATCTQ